MPQFTRENTDSETLKMVNDTFNLFHTKVRLAPHFTVNMIKHMAPFTWALFSDKQKERLYRTAKKHHKL